ncbi:MAG: histidine kinase [Myxococcales bacterium]|nr:histidine kinase [Myxococcales bacterium]
MTSFTSTGPLQRIPARRFRSLASRMVAVGVLQLVLLVATALVIFFVERPHGEVDPDDHIDAHKLETVARDPDQLQEALAGLREKRVQVSIYNADRQLLATNVDPPLAIPPRMRGGRPPGPPPGDRRGPPPDDRGGPPGGRPRGGDRPTVMPLHLDGERWLLVARGAQAKPPGWAGPVITLVCALLVLVFGAMVTARWIVRPIDRLSRAARALGTGDLSARSRLERTDEIGELGYRFDEMADRIENLMRSEKELFANVAHELRTPLSRIGVALDLAGEGDAEAARASLAEIAVDVSDLETIVDDILAAMRFEIAGSLPLRRAHVTPASIVQAAADRARSRHRSRSLVIEVASDLPMLDVDPMLVRRVIDNLLENAHKYTPDPDAATKVVARREGERVVFEVSDRGQGIASEDLPRVFTAFFRGERSRSRETGGVGLGLTLARRIIEAHSGTIEVTSDPGAGTTMRVSLPAVG